VILPYLNIREDSQEIHANQIALFNERKMSSIIGTEESTMLLLLMNKFKRDANFTVKVTNDKNPRLNNYITVQVTNLDHALTVKEDPSGKV
ncbi:Ger(x)C family spore germination C-terminal domain-containing protein, partial [Alkalihalophilus pseudofirmus]